MQRVRSQYRQLTNSARPVYWRLGTGLVCRVRLALGRGTILMCARTEGCITGETRASFSLSVTNGPCLHLGKAPHFRSLCFLNKSSVICERKVCCLFPEWEVGKSRDASWQWGRIYRDALSLRTTVFHKPMPYLLLLLQRSILCICSCCSLVLDFFLVTKSLISTWKLALLACLVVCCGIFKWAFLYMSCYRHRADPTDLVLPNNTSGFSGLVVCIFNR